MNIVGLKGNAPFKFDILYKIRNICEFLNFVLVHGTDIVIIHYRIITIR